MCNLTDLIDNIVISSENGDGPWIVTDKNVLPVYMTTTITPDHIDMKTCGAYVVPEIEQVIFNDESATTVLIWKDGEKTIVRCGQGETFDRYTGFMAAICKRLFGGTTTAKKLMNSVDKKYQAELKAQEEAKAKAKREAEEKGAQERAAKRRAKEDAMLMEAMVEHFLMEAEAKQRAAEILAARDTSNLKVPFDATETEGE